jgi:hypothetical protein
MAQFFNVHVPTEVLQYIVCQLDPISLIALSQTSRAWRVLINPIRHDYVQRLLALELLPKHGGIIPQFDEFYQILTPPWDSDEWKAVKYACCGCMKLRTHMMFDNHAILRRPYRKPPRGGAEAGKTDITDWEPFEPSARWKRIQERAAQADKDRQKWAQMAAWSHDYALLNPPAHPFERVSRDPGEAGHEAVLYLVGIARQKRRCIECQRQRGNRSMPNPLPGSTGGAPTVISRQLKFHNTWERYFPGLFEQLPPEKAPRKWRTLRGWTDGDRLNLYVVRCPSCGIWQEHSAFREWTLYRHGLRYPAPTTGPLLCNSCHLQKHGDPARLARELSAGALKMLQDQRQNTLSNLAFGWKFIHDDLHSTRLAEYKGVQEEILGGLRWADSTGHNLDIDESDLPHLRRRFERYRDFVYNDVDSKTRQRFMQSWFLLWVEDYDLLEGLYNWLSQQIARLESDPNLVLNYVLERDPYQLSGA